MTKNKTKQTLICAFHLHIPQNSLKSDNANKFKKIISSVLHPTGVLLELLRNSLLVSFSLPSGKLPAILPREENDEAMQKVQNQGNLSAHSAPH